MHVNRDTFPTLIPHIEPNGHSTPMHGMHGPKQPNSKSPAPVPTTLNPLHHKVVSFPKVALAPQAIAQHPSQPVGDPSLADEPPDKGTFCDFNS
ncbi:hypothetical protein CUMW_234200 [Citrus unshiu]|uniref:Uncharacterized protein n=1 Tax=Citrus unshiu TaxID=55188 RepID=A0A2H5QIR9_CITUN|nr:hypothetical protein CUMW_234200 [Citrus unshiu]